MTRISLKHNIHLIKEDAFAPVFYKLWADRDYKKYEEELNKLGLSGYILEKNTNVHFIDFNVIDKELASAFILQYSEYIERIQEL